jgi:hypothetical protein
MKQEMQTFARNLNFHWNDDPIFILINLLETYLNALLQYIFQLFNWSCNTNVTKNQVHNRI